MHAAGLTAELAEEEGTMLANMMETATGSIATTTQTTTLSPEQIKARQDQLLDQKNSVCIDWLIDWLVDYLIDWFVFNVVSATFQRCNVQCS